ncbi:MFS transporter [Weeksellaceae bacterium KMM 9713]|uniref:MFS transporter n=1 Tax=Profundicola chukchiensis TaxID=2961959 RepID=A0A9X4MUK1_9FLAO|nr:MFS transporter [Profundicola chukchiensis]MDG4945171.1 MFS transporter [Profundicola chukchiensis]
MEEKRSFIDTVKSLNKTFWLASIMELMERWAWYGIFTLFGLYLVGSTDEGALGLNHIEKGKIMGDITAILYLLPVFFGVIADRIGYKLSLGIAYVIMIVGYYLMGEVNTFWMMYMAFLFVAIGAAFFKPVASAIVARNTDDTTGTLGFGIFYMMVNIGGFLGPVMSSSLRTQYGWRIIFIQAACVITINLLILLFFYKEKKEETTAPKESLGKALKDSVLNIFTALKDIRLGILLLLMVCFWTMFNQLFYTLPNFIDDWVDSRQISDWLNTNAPFLGKHMTQGGLVKAEWFTQIDSFMIIIFQMTVSFFVTKMRHINAVIRGAIIASIGVGLTFYTNNPFYTILGTMIFAIGEMMSSPTVSSFIALITPKGKEGLYQGTYFLPVAAGNYFSGLIAGDLYQAWSDKLSLLQKEMTQRKIEMPEVVSNTEFIESGSKALGMSITDFENQFDLKAEKVDWDVAINSFKEFAANKGADISMVKTPFSKNDYFALAEQKLNLDHWEMVNMLWENYNPNKIWYVVFGIGVFSVITLTLYDYLIIRPREKKIAE